MMTKKRKKKKNSIIPSDVEKARDAKGQADEIWYDSRVKLIHDFTSSMS